MIFGDTSLQEMAYYLPQSVEEFGKIVGVGERKKQEYGPVFVEKIISLTSRYQLSPKPITKTSTAKKIKTFGKKHERMEKTKAYLSEKKSIADIAQKLGLAYSTVAGYIDLLVAQDRSLDVSYMMPSADIQGRIIDAIKELGDEKLSPLHEFLNEEVSYEYIRIVRAIYRREKK